MAVVNKRFLVCMLLNYLRNRRKKMEMTKRFVRNSGWWELVRDTYDANRFFETFRMSRHFLFQFHPPSCKHGKKSMERKKHLPL